MAIASRSSPSRAAQRRPVRDFSTLRKAARSTRTSADMALYSAKPWGAFRLTGAVLPAPLERPDAKHADIDAADICAADLQGQRMAIALDLQATPHART